MDRRIGENRCRSCQTRDQRAAPAARGSNGLREPCWQAGFFDLCGLERKSIEHAEFPYVGPKSIRIGENAPAMVAVAPRTLH
jgi:hypothetical protein